MYLGRNKNYHFYSAEIDHCPSAKLERIAQGCKHVEDQVWNAVSDFREYLKKQSAVIYAKHNNEIVGFALFDLSVAEGSLVVAGNECMVLKEHQGQGLPTIFTAILVAHIQKDLRLRKAQRPYTSITFVSATVNFKMMEAFRHYSYLAEGSSFNPDAHIEVICRSYAKKEEFHLINEANAFFARSAFPNAVKVSGAVEKPHYVPDDFDLSRGDAFLYAGRISRFWLLGIISWVIQRRYNFRFSNRVIPISRISRGSVIYTRERISN